nr:MAG TPA: N-acetylmuramoyl-L-alanine amidase [Caudoviricetes sp.]
MQKMILRKGHRLRPGGAYPKTTITIHSTANPHSTALGERQWLDNPTNNRYASWHYCVDESGVVQAIPDNEEAWHCGDEDGNRTSLSIEICESGDRVKTLLNAAKLAAEKLTEHGLTIKELRRHADWVEKDCPRILINPVYIYRNYGWNWFVGQVEKEMQEMNTKRYNTINEIPEWGRATVQKLIDKGAIADRNKLDLSEDMLRVLVILSR